MIAAATNARRPDGPSLALGAAYWLFVIYLFAPLALMVAMSFKDANFIAFPIQSWTLKWYAAAVADREVASAFLYTLWIAFASTVAGTAIGVWIALLIASENIRGKAVLFALACLPAVVPGMI